jgi:hypothetical protein
MKFEEFKGVLETSDTISIKNGHIHLGSNSLDVKLPAERLTPFYGVEGIAITSVAAVAGSGPRKIVCRGRTSFPLLSKPTEVLATFELAGDAETLALTLRYTLPPEWKFDDSFPDLPFLYEYDSRAFDDDRDDDEETVLDSFRLKRSCFYWTTYEHTLRDDDLGGNVTLKEGLTFAGCWIPEGMLGLLEKLRGSASAGEKILYGPVILNAMGRLSHLKDDRLPWDTRPLIPGIHLQADLGFGVSLPPSSDGGMNLKSLFFRVYTPLSLFPEDGQPEYNIAMAFTGDLFIPGISKDKLATMHAARRGGSNEQLIIAGSFEGLTLENLTGTLKDLAGSDDSLSVLPEGVRDGIGSLALTDASITLSKADTGYEVTVTQFTIGMAAGTWPLFDGLIELGFKSLAIAVVKPFTADDRAVFATISGTMKFLGIELFAEVQYPSYYLSARQVGTTTVDLGYLEKMGIPLPKFLNFKFEIADIALTAEPGSSYSFSMRVSPGTSWKIDGEYTLPDLRLAVSYATDQGDGSNLSWRFEARTNEGDKAVPVLLLIKKLCTEIGITIPPAPAAIEGLTVNSLKLSYESRSGSFAIECLGQMPVNGVTLDCRFSITHTSGESSETHFDGEVLVPQEDLEPLSFRLRFGTADDSKYALAAYYDPNGYSLNVQSLARSVLSADQAALIPAKFEVSLESALLAYSQQGEGPTAESAVLFGVDIGAKVKLSDLPVVGSALPADLTIGFESLRVMVVSASLSRESVESLNKLIPAGMNSLPDGSQGEDGKGKAALAKGFNISAVLLFGKEPRTLTLPLGESGQDATGTPRADAPPVRPSGQPEVLAPAKSPSPAASVTWFEIEKALGPLSVRRIGLSYEAPRVGIRFDASLQLSVLTCTLDGLGLSYALGESPDPSEILNNLDFTLDGMGLSLGNGPIEIGGSLVRVPGPDLQLDGTLLIRTAGFSFSAIGSYVDLSGTVSLMAFAVLHKELGDPTGTGAFVITGLAFGFGVNRKLTLPPIDKVRNFPLVEAAMGRQDLTSLAALPAKMRDYVSPSAGDFWVAAGIKFNSFVVLDSFLLLSVSWGAEIEIGLQGLSRMTVPPLAQPEEAIAGAELALRGVIRIADGLIQFEARLTENSFIFSRSCRLTGGFAFCMWFAGPYAGDFMVSLGGFHPAFVRPAHYPLVPRLGMQLQIGTELSITGEAYFALTPSCMMAGGKLYAVFKSGGIEAWFTAYADFLMSWQPFYYQAAMGIALGVALRLGALALRLELSVELKLQGPPFGGEARVELWVISFTIPFGTAALPPPPLTALEFVKKCLPAPKAPSEDTSPDIFSVRITSGLLREQQTRSDNRTARIVNAHRFSLTAQSVIPCTKFEGLAKELDAKSACGIRPMGKTELHSVFSITVNNGIVPGKHVRVSAVTGNVPDAVWGKSENEGIVPLPKKPERKTIEVSLGIRIVSIPQAPAHALTAIPIEKFQYEPITKDVDWSITERPTYVRPEQRWSNYSEISKNDSAAQRRNIREFLNQYMPPGHALNEPHLERLSASEDYFQQQPEMNGMGY